MPRPPYHPDLTPCEYCLYGNSKFFVNHVISFKIITILIFFSFLLSRNPSKLAMTKIEKEINSVRLARYRSNEPVFVMFGINSITSTLFVVPHFHGKFFEKNKMQIKSDML